MTDFFKAQRERRRGVVLDGGPFHGVEVKIKIHVTSFTVVQTRNGPEVLDLAPGDKPPGPHIYDLERDFRTARYRG